VPADPPQPPAAVRLVVIVPTWRDDEELTELLLCLGRLDAPPEHVIVVDGASSEVTAEVCRRGGARWLPSALGRGLQLTAGVLAAQGILGESTAQGLDAFWFLHSDCRPHRQAAWAIREAVTRGAAGGYFRFRFGGSPGPLKTLLERCIALRCRTGMVYGDQAIFATRAAYEASPGLDRQPLFEEVPLVRHLKRTGGFIALKLPITVSPRRWERDGFLRRTLRNRSLALGYALGVPASRLARWYRTAS
jgi:glycosyltransferase involved in cell wall biosynthesis